MDRLLAAQGTTLCRLTVGSIISAAETDLRRRQHNTNRHKAPPYRAYAFLAAHVRKAGTAHDLIRRALAGLEEGAESRKVETQLVYRHVEELRLAAARTKP